MNGYNSTIKLLGLRVNEIDSFPPLFFGSRKEVLENPLVKYVYRNIVFLWQTSSRGRGEDFSVLSLNRKNQNEKIKVYTLSVPQSSG